MLSKSGDPRGRNKNAPRGASRFAVRNGGVVNPGILFLAAKKRASRFLADDTGLTTVEYAVAGALVTLALVVAFTALASQIATSIGVVVTQIPPLA